MSTTSLADAALAYAARDWPVFPLEVGGKRPLGRLAPHGLKDATVDADIIRAWWNAEPSANIGLPTGVNFDVLDIDGPDAMERLDACMPPVSDPSDDDLIEGPTVQTPRGHHLYVAPSGRGNTTRLGGLAGIDWRGKGGYVVAPGSVRDDGEAWSWVTGTPFDLGPDTPIRPAPAWVLALFDRRTEAVAQEVRVPKFTDKQSARAYGRRAMECEVDRLLKTPVGQRNDQLNRAAHALGQLAGARLLTTDEVIVALVDAARRLGLGDLEISRTIESGLSAGLRSPRQVAQ
jgi:hypothetical protein